jgi:hypothetical protein
MSEKKERLVVRAARLALDNGYQYMASVVKQYQGSTYYHVVPLADVIEQGDWPACPMTIHPRGFWYKAGVRQLPPRTILRRNAMALARELEEGDA